MKSAVFLKKHGLNRARDVIKQASDYAVYFRDMDSVCSPNEVLYYLWWDGELITFDTEKLRWVKSIYHDDNKYILDQLCELSELKRIIESHDLVKEWHLPEGDETGLDGSHLYLDYYASYTSDEEKAKLDRLKQAIADVEACQ